MQTTHIFRCRKQPLSERNAMKDLRYHITLSPDLVRASFDGEVTIHFPRSGKTSAESIVLDAAGLEILDCQVNGFPANFEYQSENNRLAIELKQSFTPEQQIIIRYRGKIRHDYAGLYLSEYNVNGVTKRVATTQFQANDARRVFPCIDHPSQKAIFELEVLADTRLQVYSNTLPEHIEAIKNTKKQRILFKPTPKMATYLVFLAIGEFEELADSNQSPLLRVITVKGKKQFGEFAIRIAREIFDYYQHKLKVPYPLEKCDLLAIPDTLGAMENFGAIRFAEEALLVHPETDEANRLRTAMIIAHEIAHMWFGNLVTLSDWHDLWLHEAFATYFAAASLASLHPEWEVWESFVSKDISNALWRDSLEHTIPVERTREEMRGKDPAPTPSSMPIIYQKGAALLSMLAHILPDASFEHALETYLKTHQFHNAGSGDLWNAFQKHTDFDFGLFSQRWFASPGYPLVSAKKRNGNLVLTQKRFSIPYSETRSEKIWPIPLEITFFRQGKSVQTQTHWLSSREKHLHLPPECTGVLINSRRNGYYRVAYSPDFLEALKAVIHAGEISPLERYVLYNDLYASFAQGAVTLSTFLGFVEHTAASETHPIPLTDIIRNLNNMRLLAPQNKRLLAAGKSILASTMAKFQGNLPPAGGTYKRPFWEAFLWGGYLFKEESIIRYAVDEWQRWLKGETIHPALAPGVLKVGMAVSPDSDFLWKKLNTPDSFSGERDQLLEALGKQTVRADLLYSLKLNLERIPKSEQVVMIGSAAGNPAAKAWLWQWCKAHWQPLAKLPRSHQARILLTVLPVSPGTEAQAIETWLAKLSAQQPGLSEFITMTKDMLLANDAIHSNMQERNKA